MFPRRTRNIPQWLWSALVILPVLLAAIGTQVEFARSRAWFGTGEVFALLFAAWPMWVVGKAISGSDGTGTSIRSPFGRFALGWVFMPMMVYFVFWMAIAVATPDLMTRNFGHPFDATFSLRKEYEDAHRTCRYRVFGAPFDETWNGYYCASKAEFDRLPDEGRMRLRGRETWFGRHFDRIEFDTAASRALNRA
jgi:hypothetical protein